MLWAMNLHVLHRPIYFWRRRGSFGRFNFSTYEGIAKLARTAVGEKRWNFKGIFAAIRGRKDRTTIFNDIIKIW